MNKTFLTVMLVAAAVYIIPLNVRPLSIPDEARYAEIPREMITTGEWVVPRLDGLLYFEKPVLGYWMTAVSIMIFGENHFAVRLPSALAALLSAILTFFLVKRFSGDDRKASLSAAALLSSALVFAIGVFHVLDGMFSCFVTATMVSFFSAAHEPDTRRQKILLALCGVSCGLAFLTKGFLAFALPVAGIVPFLIWQKRFKEIFHLAWIPAITAILVILPWAITIHLHEKDYWVQFFWVEHVRRFFHPTGEAQHSEPAWFFIPILLGGMFPWVMLLPAAIAGMWRRGFSSPLNRFAVCWFVFLFLLLSASSGKLGTYILPCFPPLMILVMDGLLKYFEDGRRRIFSACAMLCALLTVLLAVAAVVIQTTNLAGLQVYADSEIWKFSMVIAGSGLLGLLTAMSARETDTGRRLFLFSASPLILFFGLHFAVPTDLNKSPVECMDPVGAISMHADKIRTNSIIAADNYLIPATCWAFKMTGIYSFDSSGELAYGLKRNKKDFLIFPPEKFGKFVHDTDATVTLILKSQDYHDYEKILPKPSLFINKDGIIFAQYDPPGEK